MGMTDVIEFLERMGQHARLRHAVRGELELALTDAEIAPELQAAILAKDQAQIEVLLGQAPLCGYFLPGKEEEEEQEEGDDGNETPPKEPDETPERSVLRTVTPTA
jgi:hypothetical protein